MGKFLAGVIIALLILVLAAAGAAVLGYLPTTANVAPPRWETHLANNAVDASMERHAPHLTNPLTPTDQNYEDAMKLYTMNCALCHGTLDLKPAEIGKSFYPPAPDLVSHPPDDPEWHTFYTIRTGVRYTGMPSWDKVLSEQDIWKLTMFLAHMQKLPPAVQDYWKTNFGVTPPSGEEEKPLPKQ